MLPPVFHESIQQRSITGTPDKFCCINGFFVALEIKLDGEEPTPIQEYKLGQISRANGVSFVVKPCNFESLKKTLNHLNGTREQVV